MSQTPEPRWYSVNTIGMATLCMGEADARREAADADAMWPRHAPHVAMQLVPMAEVDRMREDRDAFRASSEIRGAEVERLRARVAELERDRVHAGVDICEVAAAVEVVRVMEIVKEVAGVVANLHEGPFRHGFEAACEEIEHRLRPCEHCDAALAKDGA